MTTIDSLWCSCSIIIKCKAKRLGNDVPQQIYVVSVIEKFDH